MKPAEGPQPVEQRALENAQCGLLTFFDDGTICYANERLHRWLDLAPGALPGLHVDRLLAPASRVFYSTHFFPLLKLHGRADEIHLTLRGNSGNDLPVMASAVRETAGEVPLNHCSLMTLWRRTEFEQALLDARKTAEAATAAKDQFLAVVSHELRAPLSAITGWVRLVRSGKLDASLQQRALDTIERNAYLQAQLIEDLLDVSRIVSGKMRISPRPINLAAVVESATDTLRPAAHAKGIDLLLSLDGDAGIVHADPARVQQIISNLVSNAIKFTPKEGRVQVVLTRAESQVRVQVADTGAGIEPAQLPYVFNRFWQADASVQRERSGLGLGLSICKSLVELQGGVIRAESPGHGAGAIFTVEFPLAAGAANADAAGAATTAEEAMPDPILLQGIRVLVVDDDADARSLLKMLLESAGAMVRTAASADEAIEQVHQEAPQVLVSDIGMPGKDGYELIRELRADPSVAQESMAAIALTGLARPHDRVSMLRAGFQAHLTKPVEPAEMVALVGALARRV